MEVCALLDTPVVIHASVDLIETSKYYSDVTMGRWRLKLPASPKCLLNRLFRCRSKKTSKLHVTGLCMGIHRWPVNSPHKWPVTRKMFPFDEVFMNIHRVMRANSQPQMCSVRLTQSKISMIFIYKIFTFIFISHRLQTFSPCSDFKQDKQSW